MCLCFTSYPALEMNLLCFLPLPEDFLCLPCASSFDSNVQNKLQSCHFPERFLSPLRCCFWACPRTFGSDKLLQNFSIVWTCSLKPEPFPALKQRLSPLCTNILLGHFLVVDKDPIHLLPTISISTSLSERPSLL